MWRIHNGYVWSLLPSYVAPWYNALCVSIYQGAFKCLKDYYIDGKNIRNEE